MHDLERRLNQGPCVLLDGGMGSMLLSRGLRPGDAPERMNLQHPETVTAIHSEYVNAGSEGVHTNTFGANPIRLAHFGLAERCSELNQLAVDLARDARARFVIGDMGPTGEYLPPVGSADRDQWAEGFHTQAESLIESGVDAVHIETMSDVREAETAVAAIRELDSELPILVSLTFDHKKRGFFTIMGDPLMASMNRLLECGATGVGANCSMASDDMQDLAGEALAGIKAPLVFQPNAGQPILGDVVTYDQDPPEFAAELLTVVNGGAAAVGGCCGTDPRFISELHQLIRRA